MKKSKKQQRRIRSRRGPTSGKVGRGSATAAALAKAIIFSGNVHAQALAPTPAPTPADETEQISTMSGVVVQGQSAYNRDTLESRQYTVPLRDVPESVTIVPRALIEEQNATSLRDVLRNVPGISMQAGEGGGGPGGDFLSMRGFNARNDVYIDNIRDFGGYSRDPFNFDQIEVVKGPASSYTGRGSTGGSVNLVSKTPALVDSFYHSTLGVGTDAFKRFTLDVNQELTPVLGLSAETGSAIGKAAKVMVTEPFLKAALRLNGMWTENDVASRDDVENSRWGIAPSLAFGFGHDAELTLSYFHLSQDNVPDYGIPWVPKRSRFCRRVFGTSRRRWTLIISTACSIAIRKKSSTDVATLRYEQRGGRFVQPAKHRRATARRTAIRSRLRLGYAIGVTDPSMVINRQFQARDQIGHDSRGTIRYAVQFRHLGRET